MLDFLYLLLLGAAQFAFNQPYSWCLASVTGGLQEPSWVTAQIQIRIAEEDHYDFDQLRLEATYTRDKKTTGPAIGPLIPDSSGEALLSVPMGCYLTISVSTYDPTLRHLAADQNSWYLVEKLHSAPLGSREIYIPEDSNSGLKIPFVFVRGAAVHICAPDELKRGMLLFRRPPARDPLHVITFSAVQSIQDKILGGLQPGPMELVYKDKQGRRVGPHSFRLQRGRVYDESCP